MSNFTLALVLVLVFAVFPSNVGAAVVLTNSSSDCLVRGTPRSTANGSPDVNGTPFPMNGDLSIIDTMLQQHFQAISLANFALQNAQDSRVRRMALRIAEGHAGEIQLLRNWRSAWFPDAAPIDRSATGGIDSPSTSCTGDSFDIVFLSLLLDDVQSEISSARLASATAEHPELQAFASAILPVRTGEKRSIQALLDDLTSSHSNA